jgi:hypothetical protein
MRRVREDAELAVGDVVVDLQRVLATRTTRPAKIKKSTR